MKKKTNKKNKNDFKIGIIVSGFNKIITNDLLKGSMKALAEKGVNKTNITVYQVPGAFEIPLLFKLLCEKREDKTDGIITLGCVVKGETAHFEYVSEPVVHNLNSLSVEYSMPHGFGVLTCYTAEQAFARSQTRIMNEETNKGYESAIAVLKVIELKKSITKFSLNF